MRRILLRMMTAAAGAILLLWFFCLPRDLFKGVPYSTVVKARDGELLGARTAKDGQWRFPECDTVPDKFARALIQFEDRTFRCHCGFSIRALGRALYQNVSRGRVVSGASTISMQVIRLSRKRPRTIGEKIIEIFMATRLEARYTKSEILALYASHAPFGGNVVGLGAAEWRYLGSDGADMSWAEAATLAVLPNAPSAIHPSKNRNELLAKRNLLLTRLREHGDISYEEWELAVEEPLIGEPLPLPHYAPHLTDRLDAERKGQAVHTGIDYELQLRAGDCLERWSRDLRLTGVNDLAAVIVDVRTGKTLVYYGNTGMDFDRPGMWVDIARSPRSSGSILKPLLYAAALQDGQILPKTLLPDVPVDFDGFSPKNYDGGWKGAVPADEALELSLNLPNVQLLSDFGVNRFADVLRRSGISLSRPGYGLSLVLGGAEVRLEEVVRAYARMAAEYQGYEWSGGTYPIKDRVAVYRTLDAMRQVNRPDQMDWRRAVSVQNVAWKTGTSYGARDAWAVGITPEYVVGVWAGNASGKGIAGLTGARTAGPVMFSLAGLMPWCGWFAEPSEEDGKVMTVCRHSGMLAGRFCTSTEDVLIPEAGEKSEICPFCAEEGFVLPPLWEHYYKPLHPEYKGVRASSAKPPQFMYPKDGQVLSLPRQLDGSEGSLICKVAAESSSELFWHLDGSYLGSTQAVHEMRISPAPGFHKITVVGRHGLSAAVGIIIRKPA